MSVTQDEMLDSYQRPSRLRSLTPLDWLWALLVRWRGAPMAWWSVIGLFVTLFAFLGVNVFLSGLHSYGRL